MKSYVLTTLPGDDVRQIMWRFAERFDLQMAVQSARGAARGPVARLVAEGERNTHEWTEKKNSLLQVFDESGITAIFMDPEQGGFIEGPKNTAMSLAAFELAWVDGGSATCSLANNLALAPIHERGTKEQRDRYMSACVPPQPGEDRTIFRGAFALTEALPFVGVDTGVLSGRVRIKEWSEGGEPILEIEKRGRFITGMDFANYVTAAVDSDDPRIKGSCMVILEETDPGLFDRGAVTKKMVHQLSSTRDPVFKLTIPASRIIGGYTVKDGVIVPAYSHGEIIGAVFHRTRIPVGIMTSAKLLSAVEPVIRYHRQRFRGGDASEGTPRYDLGLQQKEDALLRLVEVWAVGEAGASLGFAAARMADLFDPLEKEKDRIFSEGGVKGARGQLAALKKPMTAAIAYVAERMKPEAERDASVLEAANDPLVQFLLYDAELNVTIPACKLWCTGYGATVMREAVSLMGGYGITEDCPGFIGQKWMDAQLEATYEGPEAVQRRHLTATMPNKLFLALVDLWIKELWDIAKTDPDLGACTLASAMELWKKTYDLMSSLKDPDGKALYHNKRQGVTFPLADAVSRLVAGRALILDVLELKAKGPDNPVLAEGLDGLVGFYTDLSLVFNAKAAAEVAATCSELVYGFAGRENPEDPFPGAAEYEALRTKVDRSLLGARLAKDRAGKALTGVMIPEALDYPL